MTTTRSTSQQGVRRHATTGVDFGASLHVQSPSTGPDGRLAEPPPPNPRACHDLTVVIERAAGTGQPMLEDEGRWVKGLRHTGARKLCDWGLHALVDDAALLISELVTNALKYGTGREVVFGPASVRPARRTKVAAAC
jgi:hypothetical protein